MRFLTLILTFVMLSGTAHAEININDKGAAEAKKIAEQFIRLYGPMFASSPDSEMKKIGEIKVEQAENYYAVTLPDLSFEETRMVKDVEEKIKIKIGIIGMNIAPTDDPNSWKMAAAIPSPIIATDGMDNTLFKIEIGDQKMAGLWNTELMTFAKIRAEYKNISAFYKGAVKIFGIQKLSLIGDSEKIADDNWDAPATVILEEITAGFPDTPDKGYASIKNIKIDGIVKGYSPKNIDNLIDMIEETMSTEGEDISLPDNYFTTLRNSMNDWSGNITMNGLTASKPSKKEGVADQLITLEKANFSMDFKNMKTPLMDMSFALGYSGLKGLKDPEGIDKTSEESIPTVLDIALGIEKLPIDDLTSFGQNTFGKAEGTMKQKMQMGAMQAMMSLPGILTKAGTKILLNKTQIANNSYSLGAKGYVQAEAGTAMSAIGELNVKYAGIEKLQSLIAERNKDLEGRKLERGQRMLQNLAFLQALGQVDPNNDKVKTINFKLTKEGQTLINGQDMKQVMQSMAPSAQQEQSAPAAAQ